MHMSRPDKHGHRYVRNRRKWAKIIEENDGVDYVVVRGWADTGRRAFGGITIGHKTLPHARLAAENWVAADHDK